MTSPREHFRGAYDLEWGVVLDPFPRGEVGQCAHPMSSDEERLIYVRAGVHEQLLLDTLLHEMLHAAAWALDEDVVAEYATEAARVLYSLGWRRAKK